MSQYIRQICKEAICSGDMVMKCHDGKIIEQDESIELHVKQISWFHSNCFHDWIKIIQDPIKFRDFKRIGIVKDKDGTIRVYYKKFERDLSRKEGTN